ncbi:hypothetical protein [Marispirochaeta sp.]|uniref:hypothetical protein n=1 Tax=Marispirochaeta sp. TaxID=2038653 RepID=UPI0029C69281|nr:hypothetical protein [Marispirochaeta sp.]
MDDLRLAIIKGRAELYENNIKYLKAIQGENGAFIRNRQATIRSNIRFSNGKIKFKFKFEKSDFGLMVSFRTISDRHLSVGYS